MSQWDMGIELARQFKLAEVQTLLNKQARRLIDQNKPFEAIELYKKSGNFLEAAKLLYEVRNRFPLIFAKYFCRKHKPSSFLEYRLHRRFNHESLRTSVKPKSKEWFSLWNSMNDHFTNLSKCFILNKLFSLDRRKSQQRKSTVNLQEENVHFVRLVDRKVSSSNENDSKKRQT